MIQSGDLDHDVVMTASDIVDVRLLAIDPDAGPLEYLGLLTAEEERRYRGFIIPSAARQFLLGRALMRLTLSRYAAVNPPDWRFRLGPFGRPEIDGPVQLGVKFNLTHSDHLVALAVSTTGEVGIDVESRRRDLSHENLIGSVLGPCERMAFIRQGGTRDVFLRYWTLKEAYLKALGDGLNRDPRDVEFDIETDPPRLLPDPTGIAEPRHWWLSFHRPDEEHQLALAVEADTAPKVQFSWCRLDIPINNGQSGIPTLTVLEKVTRFRW